MADVTFKLNEQGVRELLQSPEMQKLTEEYAEGYGGEEVKSFIGFDRAKSIVYLDREE